MNHSKFAQLAEVAPQLREVLAKGIAPRHGVLAESGAVAGGAIGSIVALPITLVGAPIKIVTGQ